MLLKLSGRNTAKAFQRECFQGKRHSKDEAADVNNSKGIWKVKSVSDHLSCKRKNIEIRKSGGKSKSLECLLPHSVPCRELWRNSWWL